MNFNMFTMMTVLVATDLVSLCYGKTLPTEASTSNALTPSALTEVKPAERSKAPASSVPTASALAEAPASAASTLGEIKRIKDIHPAKRSKAELIRLRELSGKTKPEQVFGGRSPGQFQRVAKAQLDKFFAEKAALKASDSLATDVPESSFNRTPAEPAQPSLAAAALQGGATEEALIEQETAQAELGKDGASIEATALSEDASKESMDSMKENMKPQKAARKAALASATDVPESLVDVERTFYNSTPPDPAQSSLAEAAKGGGKTVVCDGKAPCDCSLGGDCRGALCTCDKAKACCKAATEAYQIEVEEQGKARRHEQDEDNARRAAAAQWLAARNLPPPR